MSFQKKWLKQQKERERDKVITQGTQNIHRNFTGIDLKND